MAFIAFFTFGFAGEKAAREKTLTKKSRVLGTGYPFGSLLPWRRKIRQKGTPNEHLHCLGSSGTGKTRFLYFLCEQEVVQALKNPGSRTVIVFDPHGDLFKQLLNLIARLSEKYPLEDRVILIEPTNQSRGSVGLNILEVYPGAVPYEMVDETVSCFRSLWGEFTGPRMEDIIRQSCLPLQENGLTLAHMPRFITDEAYRQAILHNSSNEDVKLFWEIHYGNLKEFEKRNWVESTRNKVAAFIQNPFLRPILAQKFSTINLYEEMNRGTIILINLSRSHLKTESRRLFGTLIFSKIHQAVLARDEIDENERTPTTIFVDEMHEIFHPEFFLNLLEGGRKYKVSLNLFHQSLSQLGFADVNVMLNNCSALICFGAGRRDAEIMSKEMFSFSGQMVKYQEGGLLFGKKGKPSYFSVQEEQENAIQEIMQQRVGECFLKLKGTKQPQPYIANTIKVEYPPRDPELEEEVRELSAKFYNRPLEEINREYEATEKEIMSRLDSSEDEPISFRE